MLELYIGKLGIKENEPQVYLHEIEQSMRKKLKNFLKEELSLTEEKLRTFINLSGTTIRLYKYYQENSGNLVELEVMCDGKTYEHRLIGYGASKVIEPLKEKITKLYDEHEIKKEIGGKIKGFVKT